MDKFERDGLEQELQHLLAEASSLAEQAVEQRSHVVNMSLKELTTAHAEHIRNLGLVSGVVAPFSLTLLQVEAISISVPILLFGFLILLSNIILSQYLLGKEINHRNRTLVKSLLAYASSTSHGWVLSDKNKPSVERTSSNFEFLKNLNEFDKLTGISPHSTESIESNARLRQHTRITVILFSTGCGLIIVSLIFDPLIKLFC